MAAANSTMVPLGTPACDFAIPDVRTGSIISLKQFTARPVLVMFLSNHCPYVRRIEDALGATLSIYPEVGMVGICSNNPERFRADSAHNLAEQAKRARWAFPYLVDETSDVARGYGATCTPDFFLYNAEHKLAYRGAFDQSTVGNGEPATGYDLSNALASVIAGKPVPEPHRPSTGCSIKFRAEETESITITLGAQEPWRML